MEPSHRIILAGPIAVGLILAALTGCFSGAPREASIDTFSSSGTGGPSSAPGEAGAARVCETTAAFEDAMTEFRAGLTPEATIGQLRSQRDALVEMYKEMDRVATEVDEDLMTDVAVAEQNVHRAIDAIRDQAAVPDAVGSLRVEASSLQTAVADLAHHVQC